MLNRSRILILLLLFVLLVGGAHAQNGERVLRIAFTEEPDMLVDYFSVTGLEPLAKLPITGTSTRRRLSVLPRNGLQEPLIR